MTLESAICNIERNIILLRAFLDRHTALGGLSFPVVYTLGSPMVSIGPESFPKIAASLPHDGWRKIKRGDFYDYELEIEGVTVRVERAESAEEKESYEVPPSFFDTFTTNEQLLNEISFSKTV